MRGSFPWLLKAFLELDMQSNWQNLSCILHTVYHLQILQRYTYFCSYVSTCPKIRDEWIPLFSNIRIHGYHGYWFFLDNWILGYHAYLDTWILGYMDIRFLWIHGCLDTLDIKFFHYPDFGYPIQLSGYFWIVYIM